MKCRNLRFEKIYLRKKSLIGPFLLLILGISFFFYKAKGNQPIPIIPSVRAQIQECGPDDTQNWCQVQRDPQRTGYTPEVLGTNFKVAWTHPFQPDKVYPQVQAIIYHNKVYVGTEGANNPEGGTMYALNAQTGNLVWKYPVGAPILASVAAENNKIFFGAMDGAVYALDSENGELVWKKQLLWRHGFSTSSITIENKVMLGGRNGIFYALDQTNGNKLWEYNVGVPLYQTAAYNNGQVYFGAENLKIYALKTSDGTLIWQSGKKDGLTFKDYWPVVYDNKVIIQPMAKTVWSGIRPGFPFKDIWSASDPNWGWYLTNGPAVAAGELTNIPEAMNVQQTVINDYNTHPTNYIKAMYVLDENTGIEATVAPHSIGNTMNGATTPPCVDRDGKLIIPVSYIHSAWGRLDLNIQRITDILYDHSDSQGGLMEAGDTPAGSGNPDENFNVTCSGNLILTFHTEEYNAHYTGYFNLDTRKWTRVGLGHTNRQMSSNTQGGGGNPPSIANNMVYHITYYELVARKTN